MWTRHLSEEQSRCGKRANRRGWSQTGENLFIRRGVVSEAWRDGGWERSWATSLGRVLKSKQTIWEPVPCISFPSSGRQESDSKRVTPWLWRQADLSLNHGFTTISYVFGQVTAPSESPYFSVTPMACRSSGAKDQIPATAVIMPDP